MNKSKLIFVLLTSLAFGACSNDDEQVTQQPKSYPLTIEVTENPLIPDGEEGGTATRAAITTNSTLTGFKLDYWYSGTSNDGSTPITADKDGEGKWVNHAGTSFGWPIIEETVYWYAYTDGTLNLNSGTPYINFTVDENAATQKDLLVATASGTYSGTGGKLSFSFDHACSALRFYVKKATNLGSNALTVTNIRLCNAKRNGRYYFGSGDWQSVQTDASYTLYSGAAKTINSGSYELLNGSEDNSYLFMIPQNLTGWNSSTNTNGTYIEVVWTCTSVGSGSGTAKIPLAINMVKGHQYDVKINLGSTSLSN